MTPIERQIGRLLAQAQNASFAADRGVNVGVVERVVPQVDESGDPTGLALYDVRIFSRRARPFLMTHVAAAAPVQVGHEVFVVLVAGAHVRGAWIVGTVQPATPQMAEGTADISAFSAYITTGPTLPIPTDTNRIVSVENAFVATAARMAISFSLALPPAPGLHNVDRLQKAIMGGSTKPCVPVRVLLERHGAVAGLDARLVDSNGYRHSGGGRPRLRGARGCYRGADSSYSHADPRPAD